MTDAQAFRMIDQRQASAGLDSALLTDHTAIEAGIATLSALVRRECASLGRLLSRHATATDRVALDAAIATSARTLAILNADLARLRSDLSRPQPPHAGRIDVAA